MKRPNITPGPWKLNAGRSIETPSGDFHLSYGTEKGTGMPRFRSPTELDRVAEAAAALPDLLAALEATLEQAEAHTETMTEKQFSESPWHPLWNQTRQALTKAGYTF